MTALEAYALGLVTLPALWLLLVAISEAWAYIRYHWVTTVEWRSDRVWKRWEMGEAGRAVAFTFKHWPHLGFVFTVRPWRPIVPAHQRSMADDISPISGVHE